METGNGSHILKLKEIKNYKSNNFNQDKFISLLHHIGWKGYNKYLENLSIQTTDLHTEIKWQRYLQSR